MPLLVTGFRIACALSIVLAFLASAGTGWLFYTRIGSTPDKFNGTGTTTPESLSSGPAQVPTSSQPRHNHHLHHHRINTQQFPTKLRPGELKRAQNYESQYQNMKHDLLHDWEHDAKPILLTCCIVVCICACLQCIASIFGVFGCMEVKSKVKLWLILHFLLFFVYVLCMLTMFISNMHRKPSQKWRTKVYRLQAAAERVSDADAGDGVAVPSLSHNAEVDAIAYFIKFSASFFYIIITTNASLILLLFFTVIWLMKEDREYKYQKVGTFK